MDKHSFMVGETLKEYDYSICVDGEEKSNREICKLLYELQDENIELESRNYNAFKYITKTILKKINNCLESYLNEFEEELGIDREEAIKFISENFVYDLKFNENQELVLEISCRRI